MVSTTAGGGRQQCTGSQELARASDDDQSLWEAARHAAAAYSALARSDVVSHPWEDPWFHDRELVDRERRRKPSDRAIGLAEALLAAFPELASGPLHAGADEQRELSGYLLELAENEGIVGSTQRPWDERCDQLARDLRDRRLGIVDLTRRVIWAATGDAKRSDNDVRRLDALVGAGSLNRRGLSDGLRSDD